MAWTHIAININQAAKFWIPEQCEKYSIEYCKTRNVCERLISRISRGEQNHKHLVVQKLSALGLSLCIVIANSLYSQVA